VGVQAFDVLGDPVRRRILELIADGEVAAGAVGGVVQREFGISQPAVSQHLKVLREHGLVQVRAQGNRRLYSVDATGLQQIDEWLERFRSMWAPRLDALATEVARGKRERRRSPAAADGAGDTARHDMAARHDTATPQDTAEGAVG